LEKRKGHDRSDHGPSFRRYGERPARLQAANSRAFLMVVIVIMTMMVMIMLVLIVQFGRIDTLVGHVGQVRE
jgi:hypothetical protein